MDSHLENLKKEKRAVYMVQIRKENTEKLFSMKRNILMKEFENHKIDAAELEESYDVIIIC